MPDLTSQLLEFLPAIYRGGGGPADGVPEALFLESWLLPFETILLQAVEPRADLASLEEKIGALPQLFSPLEAPVEFLPWLADWVAWSAILPRDDRRKRQFLSRLISLNQIRGTRTYLEEILRFFLDCPVAIDESVAPECQVGVRSTLGRDMQLGGGSANFFRVRLVFALPAEEDVTRQSRIARRIIDLSKPAHTQYKLDIISSALQIGIHSTIGRDTVLGQAPRD
jgi:phage tail-like protein